MGAWKKILAHVAWSGLFITAFPGAALQLAAQQSTTNEDSRPTQQSRAEDPASVVELPDSPGAVIARSAPAQQSGGVPSSQTPQTAPSQATPTQATSTQQPTGQKPVGTAAAEAPNSSGVAASQPAGVAIAPAKQRRTRTIIIRMGAIIGAGVAVGTVAALTVATSSKPPGAH